MAWDLHTPGSPIEQVQTSSPFSKNIQILLEASHYTRISPFLDPLHVHRHPQVTPDLRLHTPDELTE